MKHDVVIKSMKRLLRCYKYIQRMQERLTKGIYKENISLVRAELGKLIAAKICSILNKDQIKNTRNQRACIKLLMNMEVVCYFCPPQTG